MIYRIDCCSLHNSPGENGPRTSMLSELILPKGEDILAQARVISPRRE